MTNHQVSAFTSGAESAAANTNTDNTFRMVAKDAGLAQDARSHVNESAPSSKRGFHGEMRRDKKVQQVWPTGGVRWSHPWG